MSRSHPRRKWLKYQDQAIQIGRHCASASRKQRVRRAALEALEGRTLFTVYVDDNFANPTVGQDPDGAGPATDFGTDSFATIQGGVNGAAAGDSVIVRPGTYPELVNVNKTLTLQGARTGVDGQDPGRTGLPATESVVNAAGLGGAFNISADNVVVDGFTIQGQTGGFPGAAIWMQPGTSGTEVRNNVIQNNVVGIFVSNNSGADQTVIDRNLFRNNTNPGPASGHSIYADEFNAGIGIQNILIDNNTFTNASSVVNSWALGISNSNATPFTDMAFSNNIVTNHGRGMYFFNTDGVTVSGNEITGATNYAIGIFTISGPDNNANIDLRNNILTNNNRGVWVDGYAGTLDVDFNDLSGNATAGVQNDDAGAQVNAENNWWGSATGPTHASNPGGAGSAVTGSNSAGVDFIPFLTSGTDTAPGTRGFQPAVGTVYVDDNFANPNPGQDPDGPGPASNFGTDSFATIQGGVNGVAVGGTVIVRPGTYPELVNVNKTATLRGAQTGVDGQDPGRSGLPATESVVTGNAGTTSFNVSASDVVIDGFTVQGATSSTQFGFGIVLGAGTAGSEIRNNIIQNNIAGLSLANNSASNQTVIERNLFRNNDQPGPVSGTGIYSDQFNAGGALTNVLIQDNTFFSHDGAGAAINLSSTVSGSQSSIDIRRNVFDSNSRALLAFNLVNSSFTQNEVTNSTFTGSADIRLFEGNAGLTISNNILQGNGGDVRGVRISNIGTGAPSSTGITFESNSISGYGDTTLDTPGSDDDAGVQIDAGAYTGNFDAENNWWGHPTGPTTPENPGGTGEEIVAPAGQVDFIPFLTSGTDTAPTTRGFQPGPNPPLGIVVNGTGGNDTLIFTATGPDSGSYTLNGVPQGSFTNITSFTFNGGAGNDLLQINNPAGALFAPSGGIFFNGGQDADSLENLGGSAVFGDHTPGGATADGFSGVINHTGLQTQTITYTGLSPINDTVAEALFTVNGTDAAESIAVDNGTATGDGMIRVSVTGAEPVQIANKINLVINGGLTAADLGDTFTLANTEASTGLLTLTVNSGPEVGGSLAGDTLFVRATPAGVPTAVNGDGGSDLIVVEGFDATIDAILGPVTIDGNGAADTFRVNDQALAAAVAGFTYTVTSTSVARTGGPAVINYDFVETVTLDARNVTPPGGNTIDLASTNAGVTTTTVNAGDGNDTVNVQAALAGLANVNGEGGNDSIVFANAANLNGGTVDGGAGTDTIDYGAYTSVVAVNLGTNVNSLSAALDGDQEVPVNSSAATGTSTITYNQVAHTVDLTLVVTGISPTDPGLRFHVHRSPTGVNGPIILDLFNATPPSSLGTLTPTGPTSFTFTATNIQIDPGHEAALLGGLTYVNVHSTASPGGEIRGQVFPDAGFVPASGTATGTGGISGVENAVGGSGSFNVGTTVFGDSLVGDSNSNLLRGGVGNDALVGSGGADSMLGEAGNDIMVWSNGDGTDVMDGGADNDLVNVNGNPTVADSFQVGAGPAGRVDFDRTSPGAFSLDIGTTETLTVNGIGGNDTFAGNDLTGVANLTTVNFFGFNGDDTFNVEPDANVTFNVHGHLSRQPAAPGDRLNYDAEGLSVTIGTTALTAPGRQPVNHLGLETLDLTDGVFTLNVAVPQNVGVAANATLAGTGTIAGDLAVNGVVNPGASAGLPGILSSGDATFFAGATFHVDLAGTSPGAGGHDQLKVTGGVNLGGAALDVAVVAPFVPGPSNSFVIIDNDGSADPVVGTFAGRPEGSTFVVGGKTFVITYVGGDGNDVVLSVAPVAADDLANASENAVIIGNVLTNDSGGPLTVISVTVNGVTTAVAPAGTTSFAGLSGAFTIRADGNYTYDHDGSDALTDGFSYVVSDNGTPAPGHTATADLTVSVFNVVPLVSTGGTGTSGTAGVPVSGRTYTFADPGLEGTWTVSFDFGDGTPLVTETRSAPGTYNVPAHTYATAGSKTVTVSVSDGESTGTSAYSVTVAAAPVGPFQVTGFTPTPSGFDVTFSGPFNPAALNLYGPSPDVIVTGPGGQLVRGSLVWDAGSSTLSFVATGAQETSPAAAGVLAAGTYNVALIGGASALNGPGGNLNGSTVLIGPGSDSTPGGDVTTSFTVAAPAGRIVSVDDFARGPGQVVKLTNDTGTGVPVTVSDLSNVASFAVTVSYDAALLDVTGVAFPAGWSGTLVSSSPGATSGRVTVTVSGTGPAYPGGSGAGTLATLLASVRPGAAYGDSHLLDVGVASLADGGGNPLAAVADDAVHSVNYVGDANANGLYTTADVNLILGQVSAVAATPGLYPNFNAYANTDAQVVADTNNNSQLSAFDGLQVFNEVAGLQQNNAGSPLVPGIPPLPALRAPASAAAARANDLIASVLGTHAATGTDWLKAAEQLKKGGRFDANGVPAGLFSTTPVRATTTTTRVAARR